jgi:hypothetical protein
LNLEQIGDEIPHPGKLSNQFGVKIRGFGNDEPLGSDRVHVMSSCDWTKMLDLRTYGIDIMDRNWKDTEIFWHDPRPISQLNIEFNSKPVEILRGAER